MNDLEGLAAFLEARIAEDERRAIRSCEGVHPSADIYHPEGHPDAFRLAECAAKRRIVELAGQAENEAEAVKKEYASSTDPDYNDPLTGELILVALALPYADHPDYNEEWEPAWSVDGGKA